MCSAACLASVPPRTRRDSLIADSTSEWRCVSDKAQARMHTQILLVGNRAQQHIRDTALYMFRCLNCSIELYFMAPLFVCA